MKKPWCYIQVRSGEKVKVDREDLPRIEQHSWRVTEGSTGRKRVVTSIRKKERVITLTLGAFLMKPARGKQVYPRRFNDGLDYRKENLLVCTLSERQRLLPKKRASTTSRYRGVSYSSTEKRWRAGIEVEGSSINLGNFLSEEAAAEAYNKAAREHFGENAYQNLIGSSRANKRKPKVTK